MQCGLSTADGVRRMAGEFWCQDLYSNNPVGIFPADSKFSPCRFRCHVVSRVASGAPVHVTKQQRTKFTTDGVRSILGCGPMELQRPSLPPLSATPSPSTTPPKPLPTPLPNPRLSPPLCTHLLPYGWIGQQPSSGFFDMPRLALGVFASSDRF
jgi:hypothetical protein